MGNTTATNTAGTITSTVRANPTYGQSIVKWTGNGTTGHGLSSAPEMIIVKPIDVTGAWWVWHKDLSNTSQGFLQLNTTAAEATNSSLWDNASPVSATTINANTAYINYATDNYIAYCFHSVSGYSKIGSYTGSGSSGKVVTTGFRPAFVMVKRTNTAEPWAIADSTRNPLNPTRWEMYANNTDADYETGGAGVVNMTDTGFTIQATAGQWNASGGTYIYMAFAGGMDSISDYNTDGSSDSRVKANPTYGQSVVSYTGQSGAQTIGHGLSSAPEMIIAKNRSSAQEWLVYHHSLTDAKDKYLRLDTDGAVADNTFWNDTAPTSSVFSVGDSQPINSGHGNDYVAYCFHSVTGYSKFSSFSGNGSTTNAITTGFEPAFVMLKRTDTANDWIMIDNVRADVSGTDDNELHANATIAEQNDERLDFTSTGFTLKSSAAAVNASGGTYIYMAFADKREYAYWLDQSGNNNDWTSNNLTESDISVDSPTNNFPTLNPLHKEYTDATFSEGNLKITGSTINQVGAFSSMNVPLTGKWYAEFLILAFGGGTPLFGINHGVNSFGGEGVTYRTDGSKEMNGVNGNTYASGYGSTWTTGDVMAIAYDADSNGGQVTFYKNGVSQGVAFTGTNANITEITGQLFFGCQNGHASTSTFMWNFGQDSSFAGAKTAQGNQDGNSIGDFYYTPPTGFLALCTSNLPDVAVVPSENFNTLLYTGNGGTGNHTGVGFQPDLVWIKGRNVAENHAIHDAVRGTAAGHIRSDTTNAQSTNEHLLEYGTDGFNFIGGSPTSAAGHQQVNSTSYNYVAWNWKAGTSVSGNSTGAGDDVAYTGSVNTAAGFSIIRYGGNGTTGHQIPHRLGVVPDAIFIKNLETSSWNCWFPNTSMGGTKMMQLDNTGAASTQSWLTVQCLLQVLLN